MLSTHQHLLHYHHVRSLDQSQQAIDVTISYLGIKNVLEKDFCHNQPDALVAFHSAIAIISVLARLPVGKQI